MIAGAAGLIVVMIFIIQNTRAVNISFLGAHLRLSLAVALLLAAIGGALLMAAAGMIWGIVMGISQDHATLPAHAHLNLLGWVSLFLFGIYYHLHPAVDRSALASLQVWVWITGTIIMTIGVALVHSGHEIGDPIAAVSSLVVLVDLLTFGWLVSAPSRLS